MRADAFAVQILRAGKNMKADDVDRSRVNQRAARRDIFADKAKPYLEKAFSLSDRLTEKDRLNIAAWYSIANLDYPNAIEFYRQIISKYPARWLGQIKLPLPRPLYCSERMKCQT